MDAGTSSGWQQEFGRSQIQLWVKGTGEGDQIAAALIPTPEERFAAQRAASGQNRKWPASFDYLIGPGEEHRRHVDAERLGGLEIDHQLELGRLLNRQFGRS